MNLSLLALLAGCTNQYYPDLDGDGYGNKEDKGTYFPSSKDEEYVNNNDDCDDGNPQIYPEAERICGSGVDYNCDGRLDGNDTDGDCSFTRLNCDGYDDYSFSQALWATGSGGEIKVCGPVWQEELQNNDSYFCYDSISKIYSETQTMLLFPDRDISFSLSDCGPIQIEGIDFNNVDLRSQVEGLQLKKVTFYNSTISLLGAVAAVLAPKTGVLETS